MSDYSPAPVAAPPSSIPPSPAAAMTGQVTLGSGEVRTLASPGKRLAARIIDVVILSIGMMIISFVGIGGGAAIGSTGSDIGAGLALGAMFMTLVTLLVVTVAYEVTLTALKGQTLGKMVMGIRVARADTGDLPSWGSSIMRWALPGLMALVPLVGWIGSLLTYLSLTWDDRRQGWHDKAAATVVVN